MQNREAQRSSRLARDCTPSAPWESNEFFERDDYSKRRVEERGVKDRRPLRSPRRNRLNRQLPASLRNRLGG